MLIEADFEPADLVVTEGVQALRPGADVTLASAKKLTDGPLPRPSRTGSHGTALFIRRPILAFVLNALIVIAGLAGLLGAEVRELPDVDRPVVSVSTAYPGAAPETIDREVTAVIEGAVSRVAGVKSISSSSRFGSSRVTVEFRDDVDLDVAATDLRDAVARVQNTLPEAADAPRVVKSDADSDADPAHRRHLAHAARRTN